jgi:phage-related protein (TIGR01555 family)
MFKNIQNKISNYLFKASGNQRRDSILNYKYSVIEPWLDHRYRARLSYVELERIYLSEGVGKKIVDCVVEDGMRSFIECDVDLMEEMIRLKAKNVIEQAGKMSRLYGGCLLVAMIDDGQEYDKPLRIDKANNSSSIYKVNSLQAYDKSQVTFSNIDVNVDSASPYFLEPEWYTINLRGGFVSNGKVSFRVHRSRCFSFFGENVTSLQKQYELGWGASVLNKCYTAMTNYLESQRAAVAVQRDFIQVVFKIKDLVADLTDDNAAQNVAKRVEMLNILKKQGNHNVLAVDADGEDYTKNSSNLSGFSDTTDRIAEYVCATSGIPVARLFGRTSAGLNSTGQGDMQN